MSVSRSFENALGNFCDGKQESFQSQLPTPGDEELDIPPRISEVAASSTPVHQTRPENRPALVQPEDNSFMPSKCPRCKGAMFFEDGRYGAFSTCLTCGHTQEIGAIMSLEGEPDTENTERNRRRQPSHDKQRL